MGGLNNLLKCRCLDGHCDFNEPYEMSMALESDSRPSLSLFFNSPIYVYVP